MLYSCSLTNFPLISAKKPQDCLKIDELDNKYGKGHSEAVHRKNLIDIDNLGGHRLERKNSCTSCSTY